MGYRRISTFTVIELLFGSMLSAQALDLRTRTDSEAEFEIAFCARPSPDAAGKPGHAFVAYSRKPYDEERDFLAIGHTVSAGASVASTAWSYFGRSVPGLLKEELYTSIKQNCLVVMVDREHYETARGLTQTPLSQIGIARPNTSVFQAYRLGEADCMAFMIGVARTLSPRGLDVPQRQPTELPMNYMQRFINLNQN